MGIAYDKWTRGVAAFARMASVVYFEHKADLQWVEI